MKTVFVHGAPSTVLLSSNKSDFRNNPDTHSCAFINCRAAEFYSSLSFVSPVMPPLGLFHRWPSIGPERVMTRPSVRAHQPSGAQSMQSDNNPRASLFL